MAGDSANVAEAQALSMGRSDTVPLLPRITSLASTAMLDTGELGNPQLSDSAIESREHSIGISMPVDCSHAEAENTNLIIPHTSVEVPSASALVPYEQPGSSPSRSRRSSTDGSRMQRSSPLNSGLWLSIELLITLSQILASVLVLVLARHEKPQAPLGLWILGYAIACFLTLPLLHWRYAHRFVRFRDAEESVSSRRLSSGDDLQAFEESRPVTESAGRIVSQSPLSPPSTEESSLRRTRPSQNSGRRERSLLFRIYDDARVNMLLERFKIALDCFFAVWFVIGNVWIFGGHASPAEAPNLYRLCVVLLTFSCIGYAVPFLLCATICCCMPCIIAFMGFVDEPLRGKGATPEVISSLPCFKFKVKDHGKSGSSLDASAKDAGDSGEIGLLWAGTEKERAVSGEDAICCICLGKYSEGEELRELPCQHHFHVSCVDTWLKINANCPLCKHDLLEGKGDADSGETGTTQDNSPV